MRTNQLKVGEISNKSFQLLVIDAVHKYEYSLSREDDSNYKKAIQKEDLYIDIVTETEIIVNYKYDRKSFGILKVLNIKYRDDIILINSEWNCTYYTYVPNKTSKEIENLIDEDTQTLTNDIIEIITENILDITSFIRILDLYPYGFNKVTCLNKNTGVIEDIRLTPYYTLLRDDDSVRYNTIGRLEGHFILAGSENKAVFTRAKDKHGLGSDCALGNLHLQYFLNNNETIWVSICGIEKETKIPFNRILCLKDVNEDNLASTTYMYLSTKGSFYDGKVFPTTLNIQESDNNEELSIVYKSDDSAIILRTLTTGEIEVEHIDSNENKKTKIYSIEKVIKKEDLKNSAENTSIFNKIDLLGDNNINDGTMFNPIISRTTKNKIRAKEKAYAEEHPFITFFSKNWIKIICIIIFLYFWSCLD